MVFNNSFVENRSHFPDSTILVVDDQPENLIIIGELLRPFYRVRVANSGITALRAAAIAPHPDLILLDIMMPDMDGYTVLDRLKKKSRYRRHSCHFCHRFRYGTR